MRKSSVLSTAKERCVVILHNLHMYTVNCSVNTGYFNKGHCKGSGKAQPCQNVPTGSNFSAFSQILATYTTLDFTKSPLAGKRTWCLLPTTPAVLPTATKHFDGAESMHENTERMGGCCTCS